MKFFENLPVDDQVGICISVVEPVCSIFIHSINIFKPVFRIFFFYFCQILFHFCQNRVQFCLKITDFYRFFIFSTINVIFMSAYAIGLAISYAEVLNQAEFREISKFSFSSLNCHFLMKIAKMIARANSRIFTNSPYI